MGKDVVKQIQTIGYKDHPKFGKIIKFVYSQSDIPKDDDDLYNLIADKFGDPIRKIGLRTNPTTYEVVGEVGHETFVEDEDSDVMIPRNAINQMDLASRLPYCAGAAVLPDAHSGYCLPIGGVYAGYDTYHPYMVGTDAFCRMALTIFKDCPSFSDTGVNDFQKQMMEWVKQVTHFGPRDFEYGDGKQREHKCMDDPRWKSIKFLKGIGANAQRQLGSSGSGNQDCHLVQ